MVVALLLSTTPSGPVEILTKCWDYYQTLDSLSVTIENENASGAMPGHYLQTLKWRKGDLEIRVTQKNKVTGTDGIIAPDYFKKGDSVTTIYSDRRETETYKPNPLITPGWIVSSGPLGEILFDRPVAKGVMVGKDETGMMTMAYDLLPDTTFEGHSCHAVKINLKYAKRDIDTKWLIGTDKPLLYAVFNSAVNGKPGKTVYRDYKINPELPKDLGTPPPDRK